MEHDITLNPHAHKTAHRWAQNKGIYKHLRYLLLATAVALPLTACDNKHEPYNTRVSAQQATYKTPSNTQLSYHQPPMVNDPKQALLLYRTTKKEKKRY